jgi:hypothetical protein
MSDVELTDLDAAIAGTETIVAGIAPGQWGAPTPCTGLDVRTLVNHLVTGNLLFAALVGTRIIEHLGHGWDLARATGQPADFPAGVAERALAAARAQLATRPSPSDGGWTPFAPEVPVPDGAPAINRLAGFLGRAVLSACCIPGGRSVA